MGMFDISGTGSRQKPMYAKDLYAAGQNMFADQMAPGIKRMTGYESPKRKAMAIAEGADTTNIDSINDTHSQLQQVNADMASAWLKDAMKIHTAKTTDISAQASLMNALKKASPNDADNQKIYKNVQDIYSRTFCKGGIIGSECQVPLSNDRLQAKYKKTIVDADGNSRVVVELPTPEQFSAEFGQNAHNIFKQRTGQQAQQIPQRPQEDGTPAPTPQATQTTSVAESFGLTPEEEQKWGSFITAAQQTGVSDKAILVKLNDLRKASPAAAAVTQPMSQEYVVPRNNPQIQPTYAEPFAAPQNEEQLLYDKFGGLNL